ncbi:FtsX-like permease family protein [Cutibacterium sp. V970]
MPAAALAIMAIEVVLVTVISGLIGALVAVALWPGYASLVDGSGLPHSDVLAGPLPAPATVIGVATTAVVSLLSGLRSAKKTVRANLVASSQQDTPAHTTVGVKIATAMAALTLTAGAVTLYIVIGRTDRVTNPEQVAELLTSYPGMGLLDCLIFAVVAGPVTRFLTVTMKAVPAGIPGFLASREAAARPALTRALIVPITLAAAAVGVMSSWIKVVATVMDTSAPGTDSVSAPPRLMALLFGGPLIVACVCAASIVFATASHRRRDNALLAVSGATTRDIRTKIFVETAIYAVICLVCSYAIVITNEIAMATALSAGPAGSVPIQAPDWKAAAVVAFGISLTLVMLLMITTSGMRREPVAVVLGSRS